VRRHYAAHFDRHELEALEMEAHSVDDLAEPRVGRLLAN
jgi:hypothetical protein